MVGSLALGLKIAANMRGQILALREIERILSYLDGELKFRHSTLSEALYNVSKKSVRPFCNWLQELSKRIHTQSEEMMESNTYRDFYSLWCESLVALRDDTHLTSKDIDKLYDVGKALGYLDIESQQMNLNLERELIHKYIQDMDKDLRSRMKNAVVMCFLGGIMTVIALL